MIKKLFFLIALIFCVSTGFAMNEKSVPAPVKEYITSHYPNIEKIHYKKIIMNDKSIAYEASFMDNERSVILGINTIGDLVFEEKQISISEIPKFVRDSVGAGRYIKAFKHTKCEKESYYIVDIQKKHKTYEIFVNPDGSIKETFVLENARTRAFIKTSYLVVLFSFFNMALHFY